MPKDSNSNMLFQS